MTAAATVALAANRAKSAAASPPAPARCAGVVTGRVDIGGRSLYLESLGQGNPTVVFEAGYRSPSTVWTDDLLQPDSPREMVRPAISRHTRTVIYDRPGIAALIDNVLVPSRSDSVTMPRTVDGVVADLHSLLAANEERGPYVLVGHSLGGLLARLYAASYPSEVVGLILVDAWSENLEHLLTRDQWSAYVALNSAVPSELAAYPALESIDFAIASATIRKAVESSPLPRIPVAIVSKGLPFGISAEVLGFDPEILERAWSDAQEGLAGLVPGARHIVADQSSHYVQLEQPELVSDAILGVLEAVRDSGDGTSSIARFGCSTFVPGRVRHQLPVGDFHENAGEGQAAALKRKCDQ